jgi:hypothetical protein
MPEGTQLLVQWDPKDSRIILFYSFHCVYDIQEQQQPARWILESV